MRAKCRRLHSQHGLDLVIVDYLQLVRPASAKDNRVNEVSEITQGLKAIAKELDIPVIAQMTFTRDDRTLLGSRAEAVAERLVKLDVDGICTNTPDLLAAILHTSPKR